MLRTLYNYDRFVMANEEAPFAEFGNRLHAGEPAPDFVLEDLDTGRAVPMSELWTNGPAVLEFGSFT